MYAVEFSARSARDLTEKAKRRPNIVPIFDDARQPHRYRMLVPMVDAIFSDVAQPDQVSLHEFIFSFVIFDSQELLGLTLLIF